MTPHPTFEVLILNGRPAAGKSEVIEFLREIPVGERIRRFHIGSFEEFDDFPVIWDRFEDDDLWEKHGFPRKYSATSFEFAGTTHAGHVFQEPYFWHILIEKLCLRYQRRLRDHPAHLSHTTAIFEFARGSQHGGFAEAYRHLSEAVLSRAAVLYLNVGWEESERRNLRRRDPGKPDSILHHSLESKKLEFLYRDSDWAEFSRPDGEYLRVDRFRVPYVVFENEPEKTDRPETLGPHLEEACARLWQLRHRLEAGPGGDPA